MKTKAHTRYYLKDGTQVPGVTTVVRQLGWSKEALIKWANNLGLEGINALKYKDDKADIGTLAHLMITSYLQGKEFDTKDFSENQISQAENSMLSFLEWEKDHPIKKPCILVETPLVSEKLKFGGTPDIYTKVNGHFELIDLKSGKGIFPEHKVQIVAYYKLLEENGHKVDKIRILNIPRSEDENFQEEIVSNIDIWWQVFLNCLSLYNLQKKLKGEINKKKRR